jgi:phage terminase large subunit GpA-like protein
VPKGALILTLGIDCQLDRVEWQLLGHGEHYRRFVIDCGTIGKHISEPDCQRNLDLLLARKWPNFCGREIGISLAAIDAAHSTDDVLDYYRSHLAFAADRRARRPRRRCPAPRQGSA